MQVAERAGPGPAGRDEREVAGVIEAAHEWKHVLPQLLEHGAEFPAAVRSGAAMRRAISSA